MTKKLGQRIIGAVILILLAVIFLPMLLSPNKVAPVEEITRDISQPKLETFIIKNPNKVADIEEVGSYQKELAKEVVTEVDQPLADVKADVKAGSEQSADNDAKLVVKQQLRQKQRAQQRLKEKQPVLDNQGLPVSWSVQVASFATHDNALAIKKKLLGSDFHVYIKQATHKNKPIWRVFVGPVSNMEAALKEKGRLADTHHLSGLVVRFVP